MRWGFTITAAVIAMAAASASTILTNPASLAFNIILETLILEVDRFLKISKKSFLLCAMFRSLHTVKLSTNPTQQYSSIFRSMHFLLRMGTTCKIANWGIGKWQRITRWHHCSIPLLRSWVRLRWRSLLNGLQAHYISRSGRDKNKKAIVNKAIWDRFLWSMTGIFSLNSRNKYRKFRSL